MKIYKILCAALFSMTFLSSCSEKENMTVYTGDAEVSFKTKEDYTIFCETADEDGVKNYYIEIGVTTPSDEDRKVSLKVNEIDNYQGPYNSVTSYKKGDVVLKDNNTYVANGDISPRTTWKQGVIGATWKAIYKAHEGEHYTIDKSVIIPAGKLVGRAKLTPMFDNILTKNMSVDIEISRVYTFGTKIAGYCSSLRFNLVKYIPFNESVLLGAYYYKGSKSCTLETTETKGLYKIVGALDSPIYFHFIYKNKADFHTVVDKKTDGVILLPNYSPDGKEQFGDVVLKSANEKGKFDMCAKTFTLVSDAYGRAGKAYFGPQTLQFNKQ